MDIEDEQARRRVQGFWKSPGIATTPGLKAVDLFDAVASGKVKAIWIMGTNPAASMPNADKVREALKACDFVVVSDCVEETDTTATADVLLPALAWGEKSGTVTNSERRISRQRSFLPAPGDAKADWWLISEVARRMGFEDEFAWTSPSEIFREHATLSGLNNGGSRSFDISAFAAGNEAAYDLMQPVQWPVTDHTTEGTPRLFADGGFFHQGGRAKFQAIEPQAPKNNTSPEYPFRLNTGRTRDQWHTMTRTGLSPRLATHRSEPWCAMNPVDARDKGLVAGDYVRVKSKWGEVLIPIMLTDEQSTGSIFIPIHWTGPFAPSARVGALSNPEVDPWSGQPELKHTPVSVDPADIVWKATVWSRECLDVSAVAYAARANQGPATSWALAGESAPESWTTWARNLLDCDQFAEWLEYEDPIKGLYRCALLRNGQLVSCLLVDSSKRPHAQDWPVTLFDQDALSSTERMSLLAGKPLGAAKDRGAIVCACFGVGSITIVEAIASERLVSVARIGEALKAGTNCGSCKPELRDLLQKHTPLVVSLS